MESEKTTMTETAVAVESDSAMADKENAAVSLSGKPSNRSRALTFFFLRAIVAIVLLTALWIPVSDYLSRPASYIAGMALESTIFQVKGFRIEPKIFTLDTHIRLQQMGGIHPSGKRIVEIIPVSIAVNPLYYCYGLPLLIALLLSSSRRKLLKKCIIGVIALIPLQAFCIYMSALIRLIANGNKEVVAEMGFSYWQTHFVAYGFQLSNGFIPTLSAILLWLWLERDYVKETLLCK